LAQKAGLDVCLLPAAVRIRRRGDLVFAFNYGDAGWPAPAFGEQILGTRTVPQQSLAIWKT
jgi:beta-galactosidase